MFSKIDYFDNCLEVHNSVVAYCNYQLRPLGFFSFSPPIVPSIPLRVPIWFLRIGCEAPMELGGGVLGEFELFLVINNYLIGQAAIDLTLGG